MKGITYDLVQEIAIALKTTRKPLQKDGVTYRVVVFKTKDTELWVVGMIPDIIEVTELFVVLNESYDKFLKGAVTPNGISFLCSAQPEDLTELAKHWYYGNERSDTITSIRDTNI
jgi:hypothetical protein